MQPSPRRLIRNLRKANEAIKACAGKVTIYEDCCECGSRVAFEFYDMAARQTVYTQCWKCSERLRLVRTLGEKAD